MSTFFRKVRDSLSLSQEQASSLVGRSITQTRTYDRGGAEPPAEVWAALAAEAERRKLPIAAEIRDHAGLAPQPVELNIELGTPSIRGADVDAVAAALDELRRVNRQQGEALERLAETLKRSS